MEKIANATWPKMALRHFVLALATKNRKMIKNVVPMFVQKLSFPSQNKTCLVDFMVLELTLTSGQLFTEQNLETWHSYISLELRIFSMVFKWYSNKAAHQQFLGPVQMPYFSWAEPNKLD